MKPPAKPRRCTQPAKAESVDPELVAAGKCGRRRPNGKGFCRNEAGRGTVHPGEGACENHGGLQEGDRRLTHGRYSGLKRKSLRQDYEAFRADPEPLDALHELALLRANLAEYERRGAIDGYDPLVATKLLAEITKAIKRIEDVRAQEHVTRAEFWRILTELGRVVDTVAGELITDVELRAQFLERVHDGWFSVRLA